MSETEIKERNNLFQDKMKTDEKNRKEIKGKVLENINLTDINGKNYTSNDLKGKIVVVNFWFTKCAPCIKEMPDLNKLKEEFGTENIKYFAITYDSKELIEELLKKHQLDFTIIPSDKKTIEQFNVSFYPTNFILDKTGKVIYVNDFFMNDMIKEMKKTLKKILKE